MRRGRAIIAVAGLLLAATVALIASPGAYAADPVALCADLADGKLDNFSQDDLAAALKDASLQGYCSVTVIITQQPPPPPPPTVAVTPPAPPVCVEVPEGTAGAVKAPNGKWYTNAPGGNASMCGPAVAAPQCVEVAEGTAGAVKASNGKSYLNAPNGNAELCGSAAPTPVESGTLPAQVTKVTQVAKPSPQAQPAGVAGKKSPLVTAKKQSGTLPFTGAELIVFALVGGALILAGLLLRATGRQKANSS
jgi:hypothetical protein